MSRFKPAIISRYIFKHFVSPFAVASMFFTFIIMVFYLKEIIRLAIQKSIPFSIVGKLVYYSTGWTLAMTLPMAALMAVIMAVGGMNADSEIIAMRAGGITYPRIFRPYLWFGAFMTLGMFWYNHVIIPDCFAEMRKLTNHILSADPTMVISENQFTMLDDGDDAKRIIFVEKMEKRGKEKSTLLHNVQIRTMSKMENGIFKVSETILARNGIKVVKNYPDGRYQKALRLYKGYVVTSNSDQTTSQRIDFQEGHMDLHLTDDDAFKGKLGNDDFGAFTTGKLFDRISEISAQSEDDLQKDLLARAKIEMHKRFALPFATMVFLFLGFPLGIANRRSGKGMGFGLSIAFIFMYFALFLFANTIGGAKGFLSPFFAVWLGNIVTFLTGAYIFVKRTGDFELKDILLIFRKK